MDFTDLADRSDDDLESEHLFAVASIKLEDVELLRSRPRFSSALPLLLDLTLKVRDKIEACSFAELGLLWKDNCCRMKVRLCSGFCDSSSGR